ncbi:hypothetical protein ACHAWF_003574 [Thalassiosira exigua]
MNREPPPSPARRCDPGSAHPLRRLRDLASPSHLRGCLRARPAAGEGVARFRSDAEGALERALGRSRRPTAAAVGGRRLVDWGPIVRAVGWEELFSDHDEARGGRDGGPSPRGASPSDCRRNATTTALEEVCLGIRDVAWREHRDDRPDRSERPREANPPSPRDAQLRALQRLFLDVWIERGTVGHCYYDKRTGDIVAATSKWHEGFGPSLAPSDRFLRDFASVRLPQPFAETRPGPEGGARAEESVEDAPSAAWGDLVGRYTRSLCADLKSLAGPSQSNPIADMTSGASFVRGHDAHTRIASFRKLASKMRRWAELLVGLGEEGAARDEFYKDEDYDPSQIAADSIAVLAVELRTAGGSRLLAPKDRMSDMSPLDFIRRIDEACRADRWTGVEVQPKEVASAVSDLRLSVDTSRRANPCANPWTSAETRPRADANLSDRSISPNTGNEGSASIRTVPASVLCTVRKCPNRGRLSDGGMCRRHVKKCARPHPFDWESAFPRDVGLLLARRLRKRSGLHPGDVHGLIIEEVRRLVRRKGAKGSRQRPTPVKAAMHPLK